MSTPDVPETQHQQPAAARGSNSRAIAVACSQHGAVGFTNLMVSRREGAIVLDPHVAGSCVITLDEAAARGMARMSALGLALRGGPADPHQLCLTYVGAPR